MPKVAYAADAQHGREAPAGAARTVPIIVLDTGGEVPALTREIRVSRTLGVSFALGCCSVRGLLLLRLQTTHSM